MVASYAYDAWGNHTVYDEYGDINTYYGTIGNINPIRYRSYYYDTETGLYYLQTRYYDPEIGRFISPDSTKYLDPESINGLNLYAYCLNNPVMYEDPSGHSVALSAILIGAAIGGVSSLLSTLCTDYKNDKILFNENNLDYLVYGILGAATGAIGGVFGKSHFIFQLFVSSACGAGSSALELIYSGQWNEMQVEERIFSILKSALFSGITFTISYGITNFATTKKYKSIIGKATKNNDINRALAAAGYGNRKIGRDGIKMVLDTISDSYSIQVISGISSSVSDAILGVFE